MRFLIDKKQNYILDKIQIQTIIQIFFQYKIYNKSILF